MKRVRWEGICHCDKPGMMWEKVIYVNSVMVVDDIFYLVYRHSKRCYVCGFERPAYRDV